MKKIKIAYLTFPENQFKLNDVHKIRGYLGNIFKDYDMFHNHKKDGTLIYRYPLIQCKVINKKLNILAIDKAIEIFSNIFFQTNQVEINNQIIELKEKELKIKEFELGITEEMISYEFITAWLGLNQNNFEIYKKANQEETQEILKKCLVGNILAMCHKNNGLDYEIKEKLKVEINLFPIKTILKGNYFVGFRGKFKVNFFIPEFLGLGKEVSRGFGVVKRINY